MNIPWLKSAAEYLDDSPCGFEWDLRATKYGLAIRAQTFAIPFYSIDKTLEPVSATGTLTWEAVLMSKTNPLPACIDAVREKLEQRMKSFTAMENTGS